MENRKLLERADIAVADLVSTGGYLNPEQQDFFFQKLKFEPTIIRSLRFVPMSSPVRKIDKIHFASRVLQPSVSGTALSLAQRSKPLTEQITLTAKEYKAQVNIPYDVIEDNIEGGAIGQHLDVGGTAATGGLKDTIMTMLTQQISRDLELLVISGDTAAPAGPDQAFLQTQDGLLKLATTNVVDFTNTTAISRVALKRMSKAMPDQYLRDRSSLRHWMSYDNETDYKEIIGNRETALGDAQFQGGMMAWGIGSPVEAVSLLPGTNLVYTNPRNLILGVHRQILLETDKDITAGVFIIVATLRVAFAIEEPEAIVKGINLTAP